MHIDSIKFNSTKVMHSKEIIVHVVSLHFIYIIACSTINIIIENIKTKTMFNNKIKIDVMKKS